MKLSDKQILIDTMKRLILTIHNNKIQQYKTFESLSKDDFQKVLQNLDNKQKSIRKMSARLLAQLFYDNNTLKQKFMEMVNIYPNHGNIVLNKIPDQVKQNPENLLEIINQLKKNQPKENARTLCWYIDTKRDKIYVEYVELSSFSLNDFFDPKDIIFGVYYNPSVKQIKQKSIPIIKQLEYSTNASKYQTKNRTPSTSDKPRFYFSSRQKAVSGFQQTSQFNTNGSVEISFKNNKTPLLKSRLSNPISERTVPVGAPILSNSTYQKSKNDETIRNRLKSGIQITSPSNLKITTRNKYQSQKSQQKIIFLGGKSQIKQLSNSLNFSSNSNSNSKPKSYMFNSSKSPNLTNYLSTSCSSPSPKLQYTRLTSLKPKQESQIPTFNSYKPSDDFIRKIKESMKARQQTL